MGTNTAIRGCRHVYVSHLIRLHQIQEGILDKDIEADEEMAEEEVLNTLQNLGIEGINALQDLGVDLNQININNIEDLNNLA
jgi:hypothetical protein